MKKFEKELLFSQVEDETTSNGNGSTGENAGEGENDAPEQEPVDEGAEADNNMYDGQDGSSSGQTPNGESYPTSGTVPIDPIEVVGSPTDPAEDDNNMYDGQDGSSSGQTPNGESDPTSGTVPIDPVEVVGYPTDPADTPSDAEGPEEEEEDVYYGEDSDVNDNSAPDNEYEYGDDGEGDGNTNDDDTQSSTEQSEEEKTENTTTEPTEEEIAAILSDFAEKHPRIIFDSSMTTEQKVAFINEFLKKIPSTMQTLEVTIKFNEAQKTGGQYDQGTITFKSLSGLNDSIIEEYIHANQHAIIGWEYMKQSRAETEFEAKMIDSLNYFAHHGFPNQDWIDITDGGKSLYEFIANCFGYTAMTAPVENNMNIWDEFNQSVFDDGFERLFELWIKMPKEDEKDQYTPNADYDWSLYWEELIHPFKYN